MFADRSMPAPNKMLYNSVDNYYQAGPDENSSVRPTKNDGLSDFSSQSILCVMDRFVKAVNNMNDTVMVPCRLLDLDVEHGKNGQKVPPLLRGNGTPYNFYNTLNSVKNDLLWGPTSNDDDENENQNSRSSPLTNNTRWTDPTSSTELVKGHARRTSSLSITSMSSGSSDGESEGSCDASEGGDTALESVVGNEITPAVMDSLRSHLEGLHFCLNTLTDTASYITDRYQEEVNF